MNKRSLLFASIILLVIAAVPFVDFSKGAQQPTCTVDNFDSAVKQAVGLVNRHHYFQLWRNEMHAADWDPIPYIQQKIPEDGTCHGQMFAIQKAIYKNPTRPPAEAIEQADPQDVVTFDVMRLAYTELFSWIVALEFNDGEGLPSGINRAMLREDFNKNMEEVLGLAHLVKPINQRFDLDREFEEMVTYLTAELTSLTAPDDIMTSYVNVLGGSGTTGSKQVVGSMLMVASSPNFVLFDTYAPGYVTPGAPPKDLEALVRHVLTYIKKTYFADPTLAGQGYLQLQVYHKIK